ncbi:aldehyde dehydrogenase, partial [Streptomyces sp. SID10244]|nr:aldehyde dehydrogenase [Streptomyces sp. SID10244]
MIKEYRRLFIGGSWVDSETGRVEPVINPATEAIIGVAPVGSRTDTVRAIETA